MPYVGCALPLLRVRTSTGFALTWRDPTRVTSVTVFSFFTLPRDISRILFSIRRRMPDNQHVTHERSKKAISA